MKSLAEPEKHDRMHDNEVGRMKQAVRKEGFHCIKILSISFIPYLRWENTGQVF